MIEKTPLQLLYSDMREYADSIGVYDSQWSRAVATLEELKSCDIQVVDALLRYLRSCQTRHYTIRPGWLALTRVVELLSPGKHRDTIRMDIVHAVEGVIFIMRARIDASLCTSDQNLNYLLKVAGSL